MPGIKRGDVLRYEPNMDDLDARGESVPALGGLEGIALQDEDDVDDRGLLIYTATGSEGYIPTHWVTAYAYAAAYDLAPALEAKLDELDPGEDGDWY